LTDKQWSRLEPLLNQTRGEQHAGGRPRKYELRRVVDALLYVVKPAVSGVSYRAISSLEISA